jgi:hypothetical protein
MSSRKSPSIGTYSNSTSLTGTSSIWSIWSTLLPIAKKVVAQTISQSIVSVVPMNTSSSGPFHIVSHKSCTIKYVGNIFTECNKSEIGGVDVYCIDMPISYILEDILNIMNENRGIEKIEELIEDISLRNDVISILRLVKIRMLLK